MDDALTFDKLDFEQKEQDQIISQIIFDSDFLNKCIRKGVDADLFAGEVRQKTVEFTYNYFTKYKEAPSNSITDILSENNGLGISIREEDTELITDYISELIAIKNSKGQVDRLFDKLQIFINKRIVYTSLNKLSRLQSQAGGTPEKMAEVFETTASRLSQSFTAGKTEGLLDNDFYREESCLTRYGLDVIDKAIGSGGSSGFVAPNLVTIIAFTGRGKTWSTCHLTKYGLRFGNDVVVVETEMNNNKFKQRLRMCMTGMTLRDYYQNQKKAREIIQKSCVGGSELHLVSEQAKLESGFAIDQLKGIVEEIEDKRGREQKLIIIDSPDDIDPPRGTGYNRIKYDSDISRSKAIWTWLRNYSQEENKCIIVTSQSQRKAETLLWSTAGNIGDDINKMRRSTIGISINAFKREVEAEYSRILVMKNTYGPEMKACWIKSDFSIGQYIREWGGIKSLNLKDYKELLASRGVALTNADKDQG